MEFGEQYLGYFDLRPSQDLTSPDVLRTLRQSEVQITRYADTGDQGYFDIPERLDAFKYAGNNFVIFKVNTDCVIEINDTRFARPVMCRSSMGDVLSFQFVYEVTRSEILGHVSHEHSLGPAVICTGIRDAIASYRVPKSGQVVRYVAIHTTLSNVFSRLGEDAKDYPAWLTDLHSGTRSGPEQRVLFPDASHGDPISTCFRLPVRDNLQKTWLSAKFWELLSIGLQSLKEDLPYEQSGTVDASVSDIDRLKKARRLIEREYVSPPSLGELATRLGLSQTRLKTGFKKTFGTTVMQYCLQKRIDAAKILLAERHLPVTQIAATVGYEDPSAFSRAFRRVTGQSPQDWRLSTS